MKHFILVLACLVYIKGSTQVINSLSKDETGFYTHALDSTLSIIAQAKEIRTIYVVGQECVKQYLPDTLKHVAIKWAATSSSKKQKNLKKDEMLVSISCLSIISDEVTVSVMTPNEGDWLYVFKYYYQPDIRQYQLKNVKRGMRL